MFVLTWARSMLLKTVEVVREVKNRVTHLKFDSVKRKINTLKQIWPFLKPKNQRQRLKILAATVTTLLKVLRISSDRLS
ncbi:MAG: hypothetical protein HY939_00545 [Gammaproteobacteria bacterium]|nr:hypothetical protein [Gammaproteobacteria bacterium]